MSQEASFDVVVPVFRGREALSGFLRGLDLSVPVTVVDNSADQDDISDLFAERPNVRHVDAGGNVGYSVAANLGAQSTDREFIVFLNPDTRPSGESIRALVRYLEANPDVASCGAVGVGSTGGGAQPTMLRVVIHSLGLHRLFPKWGIFFSPRPGEVVESGWIAGSCLAIRRSAFDSVGGFDSRFFIYMSDFDMGNRLGQRGLRQMLLGDVVVPHDDGESSDLPSVLTWQRRGRAWTRFLRHSRPLPSAIAISLVLIAGVAARVVLYGLSGQRTRARDMWTYLSSMVGEWARPGKEPS